MRASLSPLEALAALAAVAAAVAVVRAVLRVTPDLWVLVNALAQPRR